MTNTKQLVQFIAEASDDRLAKDIVVLDMDQVSLVADYFLICHGTNERQVQAIARSIREAFIEKDVEVKRIEGNEHGRWIVVDTGDIVCHIFHEEERAYYNLERLWGDATEVPLEIGSKR